MYAVKHEEVKNDWVTWCTAEDVLRNHPWKMNQELYTVSQKNCATFIFTVTLANVGRFLKFFQCRNQKETAHNKNEKFSTVA